MPLTPAPIGNAAKSPLYDTNGYNQWIIVVIHWNNSSNWINDLIWIGNIRTFILGIVHIHCNLLYFTLGTHILYKLCIELFLILFELRILIVFRKKYFTWLNIKVYFIKYSDTIFCFSYIYMPNFSEFLTMTLTALLSCILFKRKTWSNSLSQNCWYCL